MSDIYGPNTAQVQAYLDLLPTLTEEQWNAARDAAWAALDATWNSEWDATWDAVWNEAQDKAWAAAWAAGRAAAWDAAVAEVLDAAGDAAWAAQRAAAALVVRDRISAEGFNILTAPMRAAGIDFDKLEG